MYVDFVKTGNFFRIFHVTGRQLLMKQNVAHTKKLCDKSLFWTRILKYLQNTNLKNNLFEIVDT